MITVDEALILVLENIELLGVEEIPLDSAPGRVLAHGVRADIDLPPFDRARMDGYAVRAADASQAPVTLKVIGEVAAGSVFPGAVGAGQTVKIFTGAPLPAGADSVQQVELTESRGDSVVLNQAVKPRQFVTERGSEVTRGELVVLPGLEVGPAEMSVLASFGYATVQAGIRPRVAVMSTGSELVEVAEVPGAGQIRNSNSYAIAAYAAKAGAVADRLPTVPDTVEASVAALEAAARHHDVVITSGGVSMGDYDLVKEALKRMDAVIYFDKVRIRPGKPIVFARRGGTFFFGLPGNPVSTSVTFSIFVRPALRRMQRAALPRLQTVRAEALGPISDPSSRRSYLPVRLSIQSGRAVVETLQWGGSSDLAAFVNANALAVIPEETHEVAAGEQIDIVLLNGQL